MSCLTPRHELHNEAFPRFCLWDMVQVLQPCGLGAQARAALRRFGNDVEMACQALLSAGALESEGTPAAEGRAGTEREHEHGVAGTSEDARGARAQGWSARTDQ